MKHGLSKCALRDLVSIINVIIPDCIPKTTYYFDRYLLSSNAETTKHFLCATCSAIIPPSNTACHVCDESFDREVAQANTNYFYSCSMEDQLRHFLEKRQLMQYVDVSKEKCRSPNAKSEICTGNEYRDNIGTVNFLQESNMNLTCTFNSDGIQPFNSARKSVWPLLCTINDLDTRFKSSFVFLAGIWFGKDKPNSDSYFEPFVEEAFKLYEYGLVWKDGKGNAQKSKIMFNLCTCDSVARCHFAEMTQFNGHCGCTFCTHPGQMYPTQKGGHKRAYLMAHPLPEKKNPRSDRTACRLSLRVWSKATRC